MAEEISPGAARKITLMRRARKSMPDMMTVEAVQELAELITRRAPVLGHEDVAILLGIGALLMEQADKEMAAGIHAAVALGNGRAD